MTRLFLFLCLLCYHIEAFSIPAATAVRARSVADDVAIEKDTSQRSPKSHVTSLQLSTTTEKETERPGIRGRLRQMTGFSFTALRAMVGTATGLSLTAVYASAVAVSGAWLRQSMRVFLSLWPTWARYFVQPFLILYYAPLFMLRNLTGDTRKRALQKRARFVEGWQQAVDQANAKVDSWPVETSDVGYFRTQKDADISAALAESIEVVMKDQQPEDD